VGTIKDYRDLEVWQEAMRLAEAVYMCTKTLPREETYGLVAQLRSAAVSVAANIAEGQARNTQGEFRQFLGIACGSLAELETEVMLAARVGLIASPKSSELLKVCQTTGKMLNGLLRALRRRE